MTITTRCPKCGREYGFEDGTLVGEVTCPDCNVPLQATGRIVDSAVRAGTSVLAVVSMVMGIVSVPFSVFCCMIGMPLALAAVVCGIIALVQLSNAPGQGGKGMAVAAIVLGAIALLLPFLFFGLLSATGRMNMKNPRFAFPIRAASTRRARTAEGLAMLGAIRSAERVYHTENDAYLAVAAGDLSNQPDATPPGLGLDVSLNTYFDDACFTVTLDPTHGFIARCNGGAPGNSAPRAADVNNVIIEMRGNGETRTSHDSGASWTAWE